MKKRVLLTLAVTLGLILVAIPLLSACKKAEPTPVPKTKEIHMLAYKWGYDPAVIVVRKGTLVKLHISVPQHHHEDYEGVNQEESHHGFGIADYNINAQLPIGETEVEFVANKTGEFPFVCTAWCGMSEDGMQGHHTMVGKLIVYEGNNPPAGYLETPDGYQYLPRADESGHHDEGNHHDEGDHHK